MILKTICNRASGFLLTSLLLFLTATQVLQAQDDEDKTLSPYFVVSCPDSTTDRLPLKETSAEVKISGVIADVTVRQRYCNEGPNVLEAIYIFPSSTRAAVYGMKMTIGDRLLFARIEEKEKAREQYEEAKEQGKTASLLEQERPNVFRMNVANILPGDTIDIEMNYTELLIPVDGEYEFVYPTVVGPRYVSPSEDSAGTAFAGSPFTPEGDPPLYDFGINVAINAGLSLKEITCPSHDSVSLNILQNSATCELLSTTEGNRDFILKYRLSGEGLESGILLYEGEDENFFLAMIQPPAVPTDSDIPPREYVFIMDVSGSMHGFPIDISKSLLDNLIGHLRITDRFNVVFFAGGSSVLAANSLEANYENKQLAIQMIESMQGSGGTELLSALNRALEMQGTGDFSRSFIIATDGYVTVEREAFDLIRNKLGEANFFPFGIGKSVNRYIIEGMAHVGNTEPLIVTDPEEAGDMAEKFREYVQYPVLTNINAEFEGFEVYDVEPITIPDVLAQRPIIIYGKWNGDPAGMIHLSGRTGDAAYTESLDVSTYAPSDSNAALRYLWARKRIQMLDDYSKLGYSEDSTLIKEIIELSLKYNVLSSYTSFIAIDSLIRNTGDSITSVIQVLPLPEGVSDDYLRGSPVGEKEFHAQKSQAEENVIINCYPNPVMNNITISLYIDKVDITGNCRIVFSDLSGKSIFTYDLHKLNEGPNKINLNLSELVPWLKAGIYFISLEYESRSTGHKKIIFLNTGVD